MKIKLVGALPQMLKDMGLKPGDKFEAQPAEYSRLGAVTVKVPIDDEIQIATIWPENFKKISR